MTSSRRIAGRWSVIAAGMLVFSVGIVFGTRTFPVTVRSAGELKSTGFGLPLPWVHQDFSMMFDAQSFPITASYISNSRANAVPQPPTTINWEIFAFDILLVWVILLVCVVAAIAIAKAVTVRRSSK